MTGRQLPLRRPGGLFALAALGLALGVVNSPLAWLYDLIHHTPISVRIGVLVIDKPLILWINEGLMVCFFLLVTLEIKREILDGHLARPAFAAFPAAAAVGGMALPGAIYAAVNWPDPAALRGWAIPTATDIVLALAVLSLLRARVTAEQRVFLTALAVLDDVGGIVIIAAFYTEEVSGPLLALAGIGAAVVFALGLFQVQRLAVYGVAGALLWLAVLDSGINATITGVIVGAAVPLRTRDGHGSPLRDLETRLYPWAVLMVVPLFVFFNAGLRLTDVRGDALVTPVGLGLVLALVVGKPVGIVGAAWAAARLGLAQRPESLSWPQVVGVGMLGGIGFTVSLFLASLAFTGSALAGAAKLAILAGSSVSALLGLTVLRLASRHAPEPGLGRP